MSSYAPVTILLINYNQEQFIDDAWKSILSQTVKPAKVLIVDDGSNGEDAAHIEKLITHNHILSTDFFHDGLNKGISARLNQLLPIIETEWFLILSADDELVPESLERLLSNSTPDIDVLWGDLDVMDSSGHSLDYLRPKDTWQGKAASRYLDSGFPFCDFLKFNNFVPGGMTMIRSASVRDAGGWDSNVTTEDFDLWLRISETSKFKYIGTQVGRYRVVPGSKSRRDNHKLRDQAIFLAKHSGRSKDIDRGVAYLAAMRWAFTAVRLRSIPDYSLAEMARVIGVSPSLAWRQMPRAVANPLYWSLVARVKRLT